MRSFCLWLAAVMADFMTRTGVVAAALAASILFAPAGLQATAHADGGKGDADRYSYGSSHHGDRHHLRRYGEPWRYRSRHHDHERDLARDLRSACRAAIRREASHAGFRDVDFDSRGRIEQSGRHRFMVWFGEVEFEGPRREFERRSGCEIVRGRVVFVEGVPQPGWHHGSKRHPGY